MIKTLLLLSAGLVLTTPSAFAVGGIDLSVAACPGNPGAIGAQTYTHTEQVTGGAMVDCATGDDIVLLATWSPEADFPDLVGLEGTFATTCFRTMTAGPFGTSIPESATQAG